MKTEARLAGEYGVSGKTIRRDGRFTAAVDSVTKNCGELARELILTRDACLNRQDVDKLVVLGPADQKQLLEAVHEFGREALPWAGPSESASITLPAERGALAQALVRRLGPSNAAWVVAEVAKLLQSPAVSGGRHAAEIENGPVAAPSYAAPARSTSRARNAAETLFAPMDSVAFEIWNISTL